jgi:hypothetical protein
MAGSAKFGGTEGYGEINGERTFDAESAEGRRDAEDIRFLGGRRFVVIFRLPG